MEDSTWEDFDSFRALYSDLQLKDKLFFEQVRRDTGSKVDLDSRVSKEQAQRLAKVDSFPIQED